MKPQLTQKIKERLFAQYINTGEFQLKYINVDRMSDPQILTVPKFDMCFNVYEPGESWLLLRPIKSLTECEAIQVALAALCPINYKNVTVDRFNHPNGDRMSTIQVVFDDLTVTINVTTAYIKISDKDKSFGVFNPSWYNQRLISFGIALPFMGYSVQELVDAGWIKLVEE